MALKAFSHICAFRPSFTDCLHVSPVPSTGGVKTPPPGLHQRPGGHDQACRHHRRGGSRAHLPALVVGASAVAQGSCSVGRRCDLRDRPQPAELAVPRRRLPGRNRLLPRHLGLVEAEGPGCSQVRRSVAGTAVGAGTCRAVGARSLRPLGVPLARRRVGEAVTA